MKSTRLDWNNSSSNANEKNKGYGIIQEALENRVAKVAVSAWEPAVQQGPRGHQCHDSHLSPSLLVMPAETRV